MDENNLSSTLIIQHHFAHVTAGASVLLHSGRKRRKDANTRRRTWLRNPFLAWAEMCTQGAKNRSRGRLMIVLVRVNTESRGEAWLFPLIFTIPSLNPANFQSLIFYQSHPRLWWLIVADCWSNQMINDIKSLDCLKVIWIQGHLYVVKLLHGSKNESNNSRLRHLAVSQACSKCRFYVSFLLAPGAKLNLNLKYWLSHLLDTHFTCFISAIPYFPCQQKPVSHRFTSHL